MLCWRRTSLGIGSICYPRNTCGSLVGESQLESKYPETNHNKSFVCLLVSVFFFSEFKINLQSHVHSCIRKRQQVGFKDEKRGRRLPASNLYLDSIIFTHIALFRNHDFLSVRLVWTQKKIAFHFMVYIEKEYNFKAVLKCKRQAIRIEWGKKDLTT